MANKFLIKEVGYLSSANIWYLDIELLEGRVKKQSIATVETTEGIVEVKILTVAFVESWPKDIKVVSLTIEKPSYNLNLLKGKILNSE